MQIVVAIMGSKTVKVNASESQTLEEVLEENGLQAPENYKNVLCFNGKVISSFFTLSSCGIKNNSKVVLLRKKTKQVFQEKFFPPTQMEREEMIEENVINERCRIADIDFHGWECDKRFNLIMNEIYEADKAAAEEEDSNEDFFFKDNTVVPSLKQMNEKPLPKCFLFNDF